MKVGGLAVCLAAVVRLRVKNRRNQEESDGRLIQQRDDGGSAAAAAEEARGGRTHNNAAWLQLFSTSTLSSCALAALSHTLI